MIMKKVYIEKLEWKQIHKEWREDTKEKVRIEKKILKNRATTTTRWREWKAKRKPMPKHNTPEEEEEEK